MAIISKFSAPAARVALGSTFLVFGLNYFLDFLPAPPAPPERALAFVGGLAASGYIFPITKAIEVAAGAALLSNRFVPLALTLLAPILVNIAAFHFVLAPSYPMPLLLLALELFLAWRYRNAFAPMLRARVSAASQVPISL